jgi:hypothetical protein
MLPLWAPKAATKITSIWMLQRKWERPVVEFERFSHFADAERPSAQAAPAVPRPAACHPRPDRRAGPSSSRSAFRAEDS